MPHHVESLLSRILITLGFRNPNPRIAQCESHIIYALAHTALHPLLECFSVISELLLQPGKGRLSAKGWGYLEHTARQTHRSVNIRWRLDVRISQHRDDGEKNRLRRVDGSPSLFSLLVAVCVVSRRVQDAADGV